MAGAYIPNRFPGSRRDSDHVVCPQLPSGGRQSAHASCFMSTAHNAQQEFTGLVWQRRMRNALGLRRLVFRPAAKNRNWIIRSKQTSGPLPKTIRGNNPSCVQLETRWNRGSLINKPSVRPRPARLPWDVKTSQLKMTKKTRAKYGRACILAKFGILRIKEGRICQALSNLSARLANSSGKKSLKKWTWVWLDRWWTDFVAFKTNPSKKYPI